MDKSKKLTGTTIALGSCHDREKQKRKNENENDAGFGVKCVKKQYVHG